MAAFTEAELAYLTEERRLGRVATVGPDGMPHVVPIGISYNPKFDTIDLGGIDFARTKKYRDVARTGVAAIVIDDVLPPWRPRGIEIRAHAETIEAPQPLVRLRPQRIISWGLESGEIGDRHARDVP